jgi:DNA modification methylase
MALTPPGSSVLFPHLPFLLTEVQEVDTPEVPEEPKAKRGEIYRLGNHRLMCGDSTNREDVAALMGGQRADMVFTDPPYGYEYQSNFRSKSEKFDVIENDDKILDFFPLLKGIVSGFVMVCTTWKVLNKWLPLFTKYFELSNMIIWPKGGGGLGDLERTFATDYEVILCAHNDGKIQQKRIGSVWDIGRVNVNCYEHPTQKPIELPARAIIHTTQPGDAVLDLFGGSGSTLLACEQTGRKCFMMELDPHYIDVIIKRWEDYTGQKAELIQGVG